MTRPNLPAEVRKRIQSALDAHRRKAEKLGLPADDVRVDELLAKSKTNDRGEYLCYNNALVLTFSPKDPQAPNKATIGHVWPLSEESGCEQDNPHPGHTLGNLELESWISNSTDNHENATPTIASQKRHKPSKARGAKRKAKARNGPQMQSRGFQKHPKLKRTIGGSVVKRG